MTIVGRDSSGRCRRCKVEAMRAARAPHREATERARAEREAAREAEERRVLEEADRRREAEYQAAIKRGGYDAAMALWDRAFSETLEATGSRYGLCQWEDEIDGQYVGRMCYRRTTDVYCHAHNRQLERESRREEREEASHRNSYVRTDPSVTMVDQAPRTQPRNVRRQRRSSEGWTAYKARRPDRAARYASSGWQQRARAHLKANPACVICGRPAVAADHILAVGLGGDFDGPLQSLCAEHHKAKTLAESHEAAKRAAMLRKNPR